MPGNLSARQAFKNEYSEKYMSWQKSREHGVVIESSTPGHKPGCWAGWDCRNAPRVPGR